MLFTDTEEPKHNGTTLEFSLVADRLVLPPNVQDGSFEQSNGCVFRHGSIGYEITEWITKGQDY